LSKVLLSSTLLLTMFFTTMPTSVFAAEKAATPKAGDVDVKIDETNFPDAVFRNYIQDKTNGINKDGDKVLTPTEIKDVTEINVDREYGMKIGSLKGIEYFTALTSLNCYYNQLKDLDVSANKALIYLDCANNSLTSLNVNINVNLKILKCNNNLLTSLNVSKNTALTNLNCSTNQLTSLDVSAITPLYSLNCSSNKLTSLDVSNNVNLGELQCNSNPLTSLDVSRNKSLNGLNCSSNKLTSLDVSKNTALTSLDCSSQKRTLTYDKNKGYLLSAYDKGFVKDKASNFKDATYKD
ncbi:MAG: hypothetical protein RSC93_13850, partial [Erysipelotrichaceae bacterium]